MEKAGGTFFHEPNPSTISKHAYHTVHCGIDTRNLVINNIKDKNTAK